MERAYFLIAGILIGAAMGMLTGQVVVWIFLGWLMGAVLAAAARRRPQSTENVQAEGQQTKLKAM